MQRIIGSERTTKTMKINHRQDGFMAALAVVAVVIILVGVSVVAYFAFHKAKPVSLQGTFKTLSCPQQAKDCSNIYSLKTSDGKTYTLNLSDNHITPAKDGDSVKVSGQINQASGTNSQNSTVDVSKLHVSSSASSSPTSSPSAGGVDFVYNVSASTNTPAMSLTVYKNGSGVKEIDAIRFNSPGPAETNYPAGTFDHTAVDQLFDSYGDISGLNGGHCMKSASFGTVKTVTRGGATSGDISCGASSNTRSSQLIQAIFAAVEPAF